MEQESGRCGVCGKEGVVVRTYFYYDIKCDCHSPQHFEIKYHCPTCKPKAPEETSVFIKPVNA